MLSFICITEKFHNHHHSNIGDGFCDDLTNNKECEYDGGDCCGDYIDKTYCSQCTCISGISDEGCHYASLVGNGWCNDETNVQEYNFDVGDCCGSFVLKFYCFECKCLNKEGPGDGEKSTTTSTPSLMNDSMVCGCMLIGK